VDFYNSPTNGNRNECSTGELQNLQLHPQLLSAHYLLKLKPHKQRTLKSVVTVFHYSTEE